MNVQALVSCFALALACGAAGAQREPQPLLAAHAHNDYEHARPLADALAHGYCSVEADVHLAGGQLLVAHDRDQTKPGRTLERLYLEPLRERVRRNGGRVYAAGPPFTLLIDVKSGAVETYDALRPVLEQYRDILTRFRAGRVERKAVTVILSGARARARLEAEADRYAALDGRPEDLQSPAPAALVPWISAGWGSLFRWRGDGPMPAAERATLRSLVDTAHQQGRQVRFWATPESPAFWKELLEAGVDRIGTDRLAELRDFLLAQRAGAKP